MTDLYGNIPISGGAKKKDSASTPNRIKDTPPLSEKQRHRPRGKEKYLILPAVIIILLMSYYGLTTLLIPLYLEKKFPDLFQEKTGLSLDLGSVNFNPLKSALIFENISISSLSLASAKADLLNIDTFYLDLDITSLLKRGIAAESVLIKGALLTIIKHDDTTYNISRFLPQGNSGSSAFVNLSNIPFLYSLNNIVVTESRINFDDMASKTTHRIESLYLSLPTMGNFSYKVDTYTQPGFSAIINGSPVRLTSDTTFSSPGSSDDSSKLSLSLQSVNLPLYASYIPADLPVTVKKGSADLEIEIAFKAQQNEDFRLNLDFQTQIEDGLFESIDQAITLETPALRLEGSIMPLAGQITMRNVLFRDPVVTVNDTISTSTISSLFLENTKPENVDDDFLSSAALDIFLLIADNGKCVFKSKNGERVFHPVQLSVKDFANTKSLIVNPEGREKRSFRLSGESKNSNTIFSWQGSFNKTTPVGDLEIINLPAEDFITLLTQNSDIKAEGSAELRGKFSVKRSQQSPFAIVLDQGDAELSSLVLEENGNTVLQSSKVRMSPFRLDDNGVHLGNIFVEGATLHLDENNPPAIVDVLSNKSNTLQGLDLKGSINVMHKEGKSPLKMNNVHLQVNNLEKPGSENDNLAFSATFEKNGSLSAKGRFSLSPVTGVVEIAAKSIPATLLFAGGVNPNYSLASTTMANISGKYDLSSESFNGRAELSTGEFTTSQGDNTYGFDNAVFGKLSIDKKTGRNSGENILFKDFKINNKNYNIQAEGLSITSYVMEGKTNSIDSVEIVKAKIYSQKDFSKLFPAQHKETESDWNISSMHMSGSLSTVGQDQNGTPFIDEFDLSIKTPEKDTPEKKDIDLKAQFADQGKLAVTGSMQIEPLQLQANMMLEKVSSKLLHYFPSDLARTRLNATISGEANFTYPEKIIAGNIQINEGSLVNKKDIPFINWQRADLQNFKIGISPFTVEADKLLLDTPRTTITRASANLLSQIHENVTTYMQELKEENKSNADSQIMIRRIDLSDGLIGYTLPTISPPLQVKLTSVGGYINNFHIHETEERTDYSLQGKIAGGNFSYAGSLNQSPGSLENETALKLTSFPLMLLEKQLSSLFDISFTDSILDLSSEKPASSDEYFANIILTSLDIEDSSSATALTFALLSESNDKLAMSIPLKNTSQSLFTQVNNYFQRLIVKCSVSPYLLLEWPYDSLRDRNSVSFAPGKTELNLDSRDTLLDYSSLLEKHPRLQLKLDTIIQRSADTKALREILRAAEQKKVQQENEKLLQEWQQRQISTGVSQTPNNDITVNDISEENLTDFTPKSPKEIVITESMLKQLGIERAEQIRKYILDQSSISEHNIAVDVGISIIDTLDMPEVSIRLGHIGQK